MKSFRSFESIEKIMEKVISEEEAKNVIKDYINKSTIFGDIPTKILKQHAQISKNWQIFLMNL